MKKPFLYILFTFLSLISLTTTAQDFTIQQADKYFARTYYAKAIPLYEDVISYESSTEAIRNLADAYYYTFDFKNAEKWYRFLLKKEKSLMDDTHLFYYYQSLKAQKKYELADQLFQNYLLEASAKNDYLESLIYLKNVEAMGERYLLKNLPLNTEQSEFFSGVYQDQVLIASTKEQKGIFANLYYWNNQPYLNLYSIPLDSLETESPRLFAEELTTKLHESNAAFTKDGKTVFFTRNNYLNGKKEKDTAKVTQLQIYKAELEDEKWTNITLLPFNHKNYSCEHPTLSKDGKTLYFASNQPGGFGGFDIYAVNTEDFSAPKNLGKLINTNKNEQFPFIDAEGNLYFSSNGHTGFGMLDVFIAKSSTNGFQEPDNVGLPINSSYDDFAFYINTSTKEGFFSSNRPSGKGSDDIYQITETKALLIEDCYQFLKGRVFDKTTKELLAEAKVVLFENKMPTDSIITNSTGAYSFKINCNSSFEISASKAEYTDDHKTFNASSQRKKENKVDLYLLSEKVIAERKQQELEHEKERLKQQKIEEEKAKQEHINQIINDEPSIVKKDHKIFIKTEPIYFDYDLWYIRKESRKTLNKVIALLEKYPQMKIEIGTHTDIRGNNNYNLELSQKRSDAVLAYFNEKGIDLNRLTAVGYGETQPIIYCETEESCTEEQHEINRRCEFVIKTFN
ncbi:MULTISPECIES: OmpA family protein [Mesonia]|uniref:Photosystem I P700 chlorophyll a apoprotein A2 n=1 Tax=Mesonia oceanica TaxID=2687242 RepID=A0AC61YAV2_9FLAO|nr:MULTISPECIES: OmpA family protein [Mesonia]MAN27344.1 flagellar motor protein MotB [Mesonia sp.]VVV01647.1 Photosystem I P700 chlorophyll a apoprotein A2 [Mesonia oceanica]|tara:strand:+ start:1176 stop:3218 length:2043 start_codon:yes stop_codon:yes gene_type:complete